MYMNVAFYCTEELLWAMVHTYVHTSLPLVNISQYIKHLVFITHTIPDTVISQYEAYTSLLECPRVSACHHRIHTQML